MTDRPTLIYILAASRSGSTLLERLLARLESVTAAGEVVHLWTRGLRDDEPCGCGADFSRCPHWVAVGEAAFGGWGNLDAHEAVAVQAAADRQRHIPRLLRPPGAAGEAVRTYADRLSTLYRAIAAVGGTRIVTDSSKHAATALLLRHVPDLDVRIIHLVRDPHGVASSWSRRTARPEAVGDEMHQVSVARATARWAGRNLQGEAVARLLPTHRLRYEDLVRDPVTTIDALIAALDLPAGGSEVLRGGRVELDVDHTVAGNPMRFRTGPLELALDERWRDELAPAQQRGISLATWPLRHAYHYPGGL